MPQRGLTTPGLIISGHLLCGALKIEPSDFCSFYALCKVSSIIKPRGHKIDLPSLVDYPSMCLYFVSLMRYSTPMAFREILLTGAFERVPRGSLIDVGRNVQETRDVYQ